ncbi:hypothetical protein IHE45_04G081200 [Dioscorea alata]|uniref:Uncharacterized protein n=1 Tax=Dioscorea alata TaxID=55571 RepID=A0ACB7WEC3_DIOAL|nr:hypothetical protein IHE45_04G081200 [Dioscorea alata]
MGNYISCTLTSSLGNQNKGAKVIFKDGTLKQLQSPTNAAELMFENPNHFLVNSRSMEVGRRFSPLAADEDLESGNVYVMFPMKRLNAVITAGDMGRLLMAANSALRRASGGRTRVLPDFHQAAPELAVVNQDEDKEGRINMGAEDGDEGCCSSSSSSMLEFKYRLSVCRSRKPLLETIVEENICSR